jgi:hypothetical protein
MKAKRRPPWIHSAWSGPALGVSCITCTKRKTTMMKKVVKQTLMALTLGTLLTGVSLTVSPSVSHGLKPSAPGDGGYSGEELFLGIFFGQGEVAERLPEIWEDPPNPHWDAALAHVDPETVLAALDKELADAQAAGAKDKVQVLEAVKARVKERGLLPESATTPVGFEVLLETMQRRDKAFFGRFAREIQSGEHLRIREALLAARALLTEVWLDKGLGLLGDLRLQPDSFIIQWTAIHTRTAIYTRTAIWKNRFIFGWFAASDAFEDALSEEILVNAIAAKFALD